MSANNELSSVDIAIENITWLYAEDDLPWVIGYSGGKDSTAVLQLVWTAVANIPKAKRTKKIYVISTDTLVENPIVAAWVVESLKKINETAGDLDLGITAHRLTPKVEDRFWVNLIGKGYPAPRPKFRWCTSRLKISASTDFLRNVVSTQGEAILFLGTRSSESQARKKVMARHLGSTRSMLSKNSDPRLDRVWVFPPIADWSNDDVWEYLVTTDNPWGHSNQALFELYKGATPDAECPLVVDTNTPSCGDSRFGCYVCTMVDKDKSLSAMIKNDEDKKWMLPLSRFRDEKLPTTNDAELRDFRRMHRGIDKMVRAGEITLIPGPYKQSYREQLLKDLLEAQTEIKASATEQLKNFDLITIEELREIRRIWVEEKCEIEDSLPHIYEKVTGTPYPDNNRLTNIPFSRGELQLLKEICASPDDPENMQYQMLREMLSIEQNYQNASRRVGIYEQMLRCAKQHAIRTRKEAIEWKSLTLTEEELLIVNEISKGTSTQMSLAGISDYDVTQTGDNL
jgi:DNA sulfur modification protein DndC